MSEQKKRKTLSPCDDEEFDGEDFDFFDEEFDDESEHATVSLYVARWPNGDVCLLKANSMEEVNNTLDEIADPGTCKISRYNGPLFLDFTHVNKPYTTVRDILDDHDQEFKKSIETSPLSKQYKMLYEGKMMFDANLRFKDSKTETIVDVACHTIFLLTYCPWLNGKKDEHNVFDISKESLYMTTEMINYFVHYLYTGKKMDLHDEPISFHFELLKVAVKLKCKPMILHASNQLYEKRFSSNPLTSHNQLIAPTAQVEALKKQNEKHVASFLKFAVEVLNYLYTNKVTELMAAIIDNIRKEVQVQELQKLGLDKELGKKIGKWNFYKDSVVWSGNLSHKMTLSSSTESAEPGWTMWDKIRKLAFPKSHKVQDDNEFKRLYAEELNENNRQGEINLSTVTDPRLKEIMKLAGITSPELLQSWLQLATKK